MSGADFDHGQLTEALGDPFGANAFEPIEPDPASVWQGPALVAFVHQRLEQLTRFGHSAAADAACPVDRLPRQALQRIHDVVETLGRDTAHVAPDQRAAMLRKIEVAGALLLAAHDRLRLDDFNQDIAS